MCSNPSESEFFDEIQTTGLKVFLLALYNPFAALPWNLYFFKLTQPCTVSPVQVLCTEKEKGGKPDRKPYPHTFCLINPYRNFKSENSQDYVQIAQWNCTFMNSDSGQNLQNSVKRLTTELDPDFQGRTYSKLGWACVPFLPHKTYAVKHSGTPTKILTNRTHKTAR
jgi:hypothetical protein